MCIRDSAESTYGPSGKPKLVLISPIAAEKQSNPDIADPEPVSYTHLTLPTSDLV